MNITTREEWWNALNSEWDAIKDILHRYLPMWENVDLEGHALTCSMSDYVESLRHRFANDLSMYLQAAWSAAPDSPSIHDNACWGLFCDLLSEAYLLYEEEYMARLAEIDRMEGEFAMFAEDNMLEVDGSIFDAFERPDMRTDWQKEGF